MNSWSDHRSWSGRSESRDDKNIQEDKDFVVPTKGALPTDPQRSLRNKILNPRAIFGNTYCDHNSFLQVNVLLGVFLG